MTGKFDHNCNFQTTSDDPLSAHSDTTPPHTTPERSPSNSSGCGAGYRLRDLPDQADPSGRFPERSSSRTRSRACGTALPSDRQTARTPPSRQPGHILRTHQPPVTLRKQRSLGALIPVFSSINGISRMGEHIQSYSRILSAREISQYVDL